LRPTRTTTTTSASCQPTLMRRWRAVKVLTVALDEDKLVIHEWTSDGEVEAITPPLELRDQQQAVRSMPPVLALRATHELEVRECLLQLDLSCAPKIASMGLSQYGLMMAVSAIVTTAACTASPNFIGIGPGPMSNSSLRRMWGHSIAERKTVSSSRRVTITTPVRPGRGWRQVFEKRLEEMPPGFAGGDAVPNVAGALGRDLGGDIGLPTAVHVVRC
jgi:hypothetical protein